MRSELSRGQQARLATELLMRHMAADVAVEGAIHALLWPQHASGPYEAFAEAVPLASLSEQVSSGRSSIDDTVSRRQRGSNTTGKKQPRT